MKQRLARWARYGRGLLATLGSPRPTLLLGGAATAAICLLALAGWASFFGQVEQVNYAYAVLAVLVAMLLLAWPLGAWNLAGVRVERDLPAEVVAGESFVVTLRLRNRSRLWPKLAVEVVDLRPRRAPADQPRVVVMGIGRRREVRATYEDRLLQRGPTVLSAVELRTRFPFGVLSIRRVLRVSSEVLVLPAVRDVNLLPPLPAGALVQQQAAAPMRAGTGQEYFGVRPYREGDPPRHIHWKISARRGELASREFAAALRPPVVIVLDVRQHGRSRRDEVDVELAIGLAATFIDRLMRTGCDVGLAAFTPAPCWMEPAAGAGHLRRLMTVLARIRPTSRRPLRDVLAHVSGATCSRAHAIAVLTMPMSGSARAALASAFARLDVFDVQDLTIRRALRVWEYTEARAH